MNTEQARGIKTEISIHHTDGRYDQVFSGYHICVTGDGEIHQMHELHEGEDGQPPQHTWKRNSKSIGIALCCALGAGVSAEGVVNWNGYPPTEAQIDKAAYLAAKIGIEVGIPLARIKTHGEWASVDGYGIWDEDPDMRWDLHGYESEIRHRAAEYARSWGHNWWGIGY